VARRWTRRQRLVARAALLCSLLVVVVVAVLLLNRSTPGGYVPGDPVEGLTESLARGLPADLPPRQFVDASAEARVVFDHFHGVRSQQLPEDMGSGAAWADIDGDGDADLYAVNEAGPLTQIDQWPTSPAANALFRNRGDGTFDEIAATAGVDRRGMGQAAAFGDADGDGDADLIVTEYGPHLLFDNVGITADGTVGFVDRSQAAGLSTAPGFHAGASWADADADGDLDLYVCRYVDYTADLALLERTSRQYDVVIPASLNPSTFRPVPNLFYRNRGDGTFDEVAVAAGIDNGEGRSLSATWTDFDEDGQLDLYVANDLSDNVLFLGRAGGAFEDVSHAAWVADYRGAMGLASGDWDNDGDADLFITHWIAQENALYNNMVGDMAKARSAATDSSASASPRARFMDVADQFGLGQVALDYVGWGTAFIDYDLDGKLDLLVANGSTFPRDDDPTQLVPMSLQLFWNRGQRQGFYEVSRGSGEALTAPAVARGLAVADYDADGDMDAFVVVNGARARLLRNEGDTTSHWLEVRLAAPEAQRNRADVTVVHGDVRQRRAGGTSSSYYSQHSDVRHFGLGTSTQVDSLIVDWADGRRSILLDEAADRILDVPPPDHAEVNN
jgi:enediyne biosynthesis protein E4